MEKLDDHFVSAGSALNGRFPDNTQPVPTTPKEANSVFKFMEINIREIQNVMLYRG